MTIGQPDFGRAGLPDLSSMTEEEQIAYAMQMSLQGAGGCRSRRDSLGNRRPPAPGVHFPWIFWGGIRCFAEFAQAEAAEVDSGAAMDTSEPAKVRLRENARLIPEHSNLFQPHPMNPIPSTGRELSDP